MCSGTSTAVLIVTTTSPPVSGTITGPYGVSIVVPGLTGPYGISGPTGFPAGSLGTMFPATTYSGTSTAEPCASGTSTATFS